MLKIGDLVKPAKHWIDGHNSGIFVDLIPIEDAPIGIIIKMATQKVAKIYWLDLSKTPFSWVWGWHTDNLEKINK